MAGLICLMLNLTACGDDGFQRHHGNGDGGRVFGRDLVGGD